jgi:2-aminoethylphosphonate transport system ATP-binding protein
MASPSSSPVPPSPAALPQDRRTRSAGLEIEALTVAYGHRVALDGVSLAVEPGEWLTILGASGCGKTTLLRTVAGFVAVRSGAVRVAGRDVTHVPPARRDIGMVYQQYALFPHMTVFENVAFALRVRRTPGAEVERRVAATLRRVRLVDAEHLRPDQLSGGMQQRTALARALVWEPSLLLLDEPLSALDTNLRAQVQRELHALRADYPDLTVVLVTHDREEAMLLSDRIALLHLGRLQQFGTPADLYDRPTSRYVAEYLGPWNVLPERAGPGDGIGGIRPEHVRVDDRGPARLGARVVERDWLGSHVRLRLAVEGTDALWLVTCERSAAPPKDATLAVSYDPEDAVVVHA